MNLKKSLDLLLYYHKKRDKKESIQSLKCGDILFNSDLIINKCKSIVFYNYAAILDKKYNKRAELKALEIERSIILKFFNKKVSIEELSKIKSKNMNELLDIREKMLQSQNYQTPILKDFFKEIVSNVFQISPPKCKYSIVAFGSHANQLATSYSDFEFGFLISDTTQIPHFLNLSYILYIRIINLQETILPHLLSEGKYLVKNGFNDTISCVGLTFDGSGVSGKGNKTPFGDGKNFSLIQTPLVMAQYLDRLDDKWWHDIDAHLCFELTNCVLIDGSNDLYKNYLMYIEKQLDVPYNDKISLREYISFHHHIVQDLQKFKPTGDYSIVNVKRDLYLFPSIYINRLCLRHKIQEVGVFCRLQRLFEKKIISKSEIKDYTWLFLNIFNIRMKTHSYYKSHFEYASCKDFPKHTGRGIIYKIDETILELLFQIISKMYSNFENLTNFISKSKKQF